MAQPAGHVVPPTRAGVGPSCVGLPDGPWPTVLAFLGDRFPLVPHDDWLRRMAEGDVVDEFGTPVTPQRPYQSHLRVYYYRELDHEPRVPFEETVLFRDDHLLVVDKPHFLPVIPGGRYLHETLLVRLKHKLGLDTLVPVHRIDRETAGLVLFSVCPASRGAYQDLFRLRQVHKTYEAIAPWRADLALPRTHTSRMQEGAAGEPFFKMFEAPGAPNAETRIALLATHGPLARYQLSPVTGRKHQLRLHMAALGIPIVNDLFYPVVRHGPDDPDDHTQPLQLLAHSLAFTDPRTRQARQFESRRHLVLPGTSG